MKLIPSLVLVFAVAALAGLLSCSQNQREPEKKELGPDQQVLDQLSAAGSNLERPHPIEFFLYFPTEELANRAASEIKAEGFNVKVELGADKSSWLCLATRQMTPRYEDLTRIRKRFDEIARKFQGEYDGWGTPVVK
jgi:regulator of RNase E activity RraB